MAIASPTRQSDIEHLAVLADIIEIGYRGYQRNQKPETKTILEELGQSYLELQEKINTYDYSKEDKHHWEMEAFWRRVHSPDSLSPGGG